MLRLTIAFLALLAATASQAHAQPSFDCTKAVLPDEKAICNNPYLSEADLLISRAYETYTPEFQPKRKVARSFLADRQKCGSDEACIAAVQDATLDTFAGWSLEKQGVNGLWLSSYARALMAFKAAHMASSEPPLLPGALESPGQCVRTRIADITTRFGEPITYENAVAGTAISYSNGIFNVSYIREEAFYGVKAGQDVVLCLMNIPYDCPDGDVRGRFYYTLNTVSYSEWVLPDGQHMCGGA